jgi:FixJ family two-component response regulator
MLSASGARMLGLMNVKGSAAENPLVSIVDDDASTRKSAQRPHLLVRLKNGGIRICPRIFGVRPRQGNGVPHPRYGMPNMNGLELQDLLGSNNYRIPIIFVAAQASDDLQRRAMQAGAVAFLRKPVSERALISAILAVLWQGRGDEN